MPARIRRAPSKPSSGGPARPRERAAAFSSTCARPSDIRVTCGGRFGASGNQIVAVTQASARALRVSAMLGSARGGGRTCRAAAASERAPRDGMASWRRGSENPVSQTGKTRLRRFAGCACAWGPPSPRGVTRLRRVFRARADGLLHRVFSATPPPRRPAPCAPVEAEPTSTHDSAADASHRCRIAPEPGAVAPCARLSATCRSACAEPRRTLGIVAALARDRCERDAWSCTGGGRTCRTASRVGASSACVRWRAAGMAPKTRFRRPEKRGSGVPPVVRARGDPHPHAVSLACAAFFASGSTVCSTGFSPPRRHLAGAHRARPSRRSRPAPTIPQPTRRIVAVQRQSLARWLRVHGHRRRAGQRARSRAGRFRSLPYAGLGARCV